MKIVVLAGGTSTERDISINTSLKVCESLRRNGHDANIIDVFFGLEDAIDERDFFMDKSDIEKRAEDMKANTGAVAEEVDKRKKLGVGFFGRSVLALCEKADIVFMGLHGSNGEDGKIQATFDLLGIRYTGTGYLSSAISMNKELTKRVLTAADIPMPKGLHLKKGHKVEYVPYPCIVKPCCGGSSVGVTIAHNEAEFNAGLETAFSYEDEVLVEEFITAREFSVAVLDGKALPVIEIAPKEGFYDYKNKYSAGAAVETCPANIPEDIAVKMKAYAERACEAVGIETYCRIDQLLDADGNIYVLEINSLPGMTATSLIPQEAAAVGMSYDELTQKIIEVSMAKYE